MTVLTQDLTIPFQMADGSLLNVNWRRAVRFTLGNPDAAMAGLVGYQIVEVIPNEVGIITTPDFPPGPMQVRIDGRSYTFVNPDDDEPRDLGPLIGVAVAYGAEIVEQAHGYAVSAAASAAAVGDVADIIGTATDVGVAVITADDEGAARDAIGAVDAPTVAATGARSLAVKGKTLGGNITVKAGYGWQQMWAEWDWDNWIKPQIDRAILLGLRSIRCISGPRAITAYGAFPAWIASTAYPVNRIAVNSGNVYRCTTAGTTASSGGPTGTGSSITDGTVVWQFVRAGNTTALTQSQYDAHWAQLVAYCATKNLDVYPCLCEIYDFDYISASDYQDTAVTASIVTTAAVLSEYPNVIAFDIFQEGDNKTGAAWKASRTYSTGDRINNGGKAYQATAGGTAASSGGPTGTGSSITDGTVTWAYRGIPLLKADVLALLAKIRAVSNVPITMSFNPTSISNAWSDITNLWYLCLADPAGLDFIDAHIYNSAIGPGDIDFLATQLHKPVIVGEFGADQSQSSDDQVARYNTIVPIHRRDGVIGSYVWALADQGLTAAGQAGVWDNTGFTQDAAGHTPLSTTSGVRAGLAAVLRQMAIHQHPSTYVPPNMVEPARARPPRNSVWPGGYASFWVNGSNTTLSSDGRGLGVKCTAGGSTTEIYLSATSTVQAPLRVAGNTWYRMAFEVVADAAARTFEVYVEWYNDAGVWQGRSPGSSDSFQGADEINIPTTLECLVKSHASATRCEPRIIWSSAQATNEVHVLRSFRFDEA